MRHSKTGLPIVTMGRQFIDGWIRRRPHREMRRGRFHPFLPTIYLARFPLRQLLLAAFCCIMLIPGLPVSAEAPPLSEDSRRTGPEGSSESPGEPNQIYSENGNEKSDPFSLTGIWEYKKGWDPAWLASEAADGWKEIHLPGNITERESLLQFYEGWVTIRKPLSEEIRTLLSSGEPVAFYSGEVTDVAIFYVGQQKIGQTGTVDPYSSGDRIPLLKVLNLSPAVFNAEDLQESRGPKYVTIALYTNGNYPLRVRETEMALGPAGEILRRFYTDEIIHLLLLSSYFLVGFYHLLLFSRRRSEKHNLFFGLFCIAAAGMWLSQTGFIRDFAVPIWRNRVEHLLLFSLLPLLLLFLSHLFYRKYSRSALAMAGLGGLLGISTLLGQFPVVRLSLEIWMILALPFLIYLGYYIVRAAREGNLDAKYLSLGTLLLTAGALHDIFLEVRLIETGIDLAPYAFASFILGIAIMLASRFMGLHNRVEQLNETLEARVEERTEQLNQSYDKLRLIKERQDGDYFLTSLLLTPLWKNEIQEGSSVSAEMLIRQKKKFEFRKWTGEIGGDYCSVHTISLLGRDYTLFANGDAMGKSMQGAGGGLVMGTVFRALVQRTRNAAAARNHYPEQWLKQCFLELQSVFVSFDGSMMISAVIGLVDNESGLLYYANFEHPRPVLFRQGAASFTEEPIHPKIGMVDGFGDIQISCLALQPGDTLVAGSDGRDDWLYITEGRTDPLMNEDELQFLKFVEHTQADLPEIETRIRSNGEITDDLSLLSIRFDPDLPVSRGSDPNQIDEAPMDWEKSPANVDSLPGQTISNGHHSSFSIAQIHRFNPVDEDLLFRAALKLKRSGHLIHATDLAERCRLRNPQHVRNLVNLADIYRLRGQTDQSMRLLTILEELEHSPEVQRLRNLVNRMPAG